VPDSSVIGYILTTGGAGIAAAFLLVVLGFLVPRTYYDRAVERGERLEKAIADLQAALDAERQQVTEVSGTAATTNALIAALVTLARGDPEHRPYQRRGPDEDPYAQALMPGDGDR